MSLIKTVSLGLLATSVAMTIAAAPAAAQQQQKPNIILRTIQVPSQITLGAKVVLTPRTRAPTTEQRRAEARTQRRSSAKWRCGVPSMPKFAKLTEQSN